jgi:hypothetical protein
MVRAYVVALTTVLALATVGGCDLSRFQPGEPKPSESATSAAPAYLATPKVGECHKLTLKNIAAESDTKKPVDCSEKHTTRTVAVVKAPAALTGGSNDAQAYAVGKACGPALDEILGADAQTRAKTLYSLAWFMPTKAQKAKGAKWMRCDVTMTDQRHAYALKTKTPFLDGEPEKTEMVCGRINPDNQDAWELVPCAVKHQFVPRKYIPVPKGTSFKEAEAGAEKACKTHGPLYTWSHAEKWGSGERFYICWDIIEGSLPKELGGDEIVV